MTHLLRAVLICGALLPAGGALAAAFTRADVDHDGYVTYQDARRVLPLLTEVSFGKFDLDRDGVLNRSEWTGLDNFYTLFYRDL